MTQAQIAETPQNLDAADPCRQMVAYIQNLLTRQIERLRNYDIDGAVVLAEESSRVANTLAADRVLERPEFAQDRQRIQRLYQEVSLIIATERAEVAEKLRAIRRGIRTLGMYGKNA